MYQLCSLNYAITWKDYFYSFGPANNDEVIIQDVSVTLNFSLPFLGGLYKTIRITRDGLISLGARNGTLEPNTLIPFLGTSVIPRSIKYSHEKVYYRQVHDQGTLDKIASDIRSEFIEHLSYKSQWALIVTVNNISVYGCFALRENLCLICTSNVIYQTVLTSNGQRSFVTFNLLQVKNSRNDCLPAIHTGFNAGDSRRYFYVEYSTENGETDNSNLLFYFYSQDPGQKSIYNVDGENILSACNKMGRLEIYPSQMLYFGRDKFNISGPCFKKNQTGNNINVTFDQDIYSCVIVDIFRIECNAPVFSKLGRKRISLTFNDIIYEGFITVVDVTAHMIPDLFIDVINANPDDLFHVHWTPINLENVLVEINGVQVDYFFDERGAVISKSFLELNYGLFLDSGETTLNPLVHQHGKNPSKRFLRRILLKVVRLNLIVQTISLSIMNKPVNESSCAQWYKNEIKDSKLDKLVDEISRKNPCPPVVSPDFPNQFMNFVLDDNCKPTLAGKKACEFFYSGAKGCYKSINNKGSVVRCCYGKDNTLLLTPPGGGSLDIASSNINKWDEFSRNTFPYILCCKFESQCKTFYKKRPVIDSRHFQLPRVARGTGDPHFVTLDGTSFDFNPIGEFTYLMTDTDVVQCRISQYIDIVTGPKQACYFSAFVFRSNLSDILQVELNLLYQFSFMLNGRAVAFSDGGYHMFEEVALNIMSNDTCVVYMQSGVSVEIKIASKMLHAVASVPQSVKGQVRGLIGNWDDDPSNDLMLPNGTWIPVNSTNVNIHYMFGMSWSTTNTSSLFTYSRRLQWEDYQNKSFMPDFSTPPNNSVCNNDKACEYDIMVTNDVNVGLTNIQIKNRTHAMENFFSEIACLFVVNLHHGAVFINNTYKKNVTYFLQCDTDYQLIGPETITCTNGMFSEQFGTCSLVERPRSSAETMIIGCSFYFLALSSMQLFFRI